MGSPEDGVPSAHATHLAAMLSIYTDEASLFAALGAPYGVAATGQSPEDLGRELFQNRLADIRAAVCGQSAVRAFCQDENVNDVTSIAALCWAPLVAANLRGIDAAMIACLVARIGVRRVCAGLWP